MESNCGGTVNTEGQLRNFRFSPARRDDLCLAPIRFRAAEAWSHRALEPWYGHGPAWLSTWTEHAASLDSAYPQPDGEHILT